MEQLLSIAFHRECLLQYPRGLPQTLLDTLVEAYTASTVAVQDIPGNIISHVRAYASLLVEETDTDSSGFSDQGNDFQARHTGKNTPDVALRQVFCYLESAHIQHSDAVHCKLSPPIHTTPWPRIISHEKITIRPIVAYCLANCALKVLVGDMVNATMDDFGVLDYSINSAGAVLDTLALLSTRGDAVGTALQVFITVGIRHAPRESVCHEPIVVPTKKSSNIVFLRTSAVRTEVEQIMILEKILMKHRSEDLPHQVPVCGRRCLETQTNEKCESRGHFITAFRTTSVVHA